MSHERGRSVRLDAARKRDRASADPCIGRPPGGRHGAAYLEALDSDNPESAAQEADWISEALGEGAAWMLASEVSGLDFGKLADEVEDALRDGRLND